MKKILLIARTKNINGGGEKTFLTNLVNNELVSGSYNCSYFYIEGNNSHCLKGIKVFDEYIIYDLYNIFLLIKEVIKSDIVHLNSVNNLSTFFLALLVRIFNKNVVVNFHSNMTATKYDKYHFFRFVRKFIVANFCIFFKKNIFITSFQKGTYSNICLFKRIFELKSVIIPNFIDKIIILDKKDVEISNKIIFVGRFSKNKGGEDVVTIAKVLKEFEFIILGKNYLNSKDYPKNILFVGEVDNKRVLEYLSKNNILLFPSYDETFGIAILEAMANGMVILTSDLPQISEWFNNGENGYLFTPGNIEEISRQIKKVILDINLIRRISNNNLRDAKKFTSETIVLEYTKLYKSILDK
jgi:glycosyltransferase involved in cell wall biosynthesis